MNVVRLPISLECCLNLTEELLISTKDVVTKWGSLLQKFLKGSDDEVCPCRFRLTLDVFLFLGNSVESL